MVIGRAQATMTSAQDIGDHSGGPGTTGDGAGLTWRAVPGFGTIWQAEVVLHGVSLRSVALALGGGRLAVYSPLPGMDAAGHAELSRLGRPTFLVAPNHFHNRGLAGHAAAHPGVEIVAAAAAVPRLRRQCRLAVGDEAPLRAALPAGLALLAPPTSRTGELWISVEAAGARAWMVGDAFFNIARTPRTPMGLLLRLLGISPGLRIGTSFRWLIRDRAAYLAWLLATLRTHPPTALVPCHGDILQGPDLPDRLARLAEARLR
jgi:hypothetical protein